MHFKIILIHLCVGGDSVQMLRTEFKALSTWSMHPIIQLHHTPHCFLKCNLKIKLFYASFMQIPADIFQKL